MIRPFATRFAAGLVALGFVVPIVARMAPAMLIVADPVVHADALYVFPGAVPQRADCAAALYRDNVAPRVVVSGERIRPELEVLGLPLSDAEINARLLVRDGVPREAIVILNEGTSTWEDASALRRWVSTTPSIRRIAAVTSPTHSRRARRTLAKVFRDMPVEIAVQPCPSTIAPHWWRNEDDLLRVINEYIKLAYYTLAH